MKYSVCLCVFTSHKSRIQPHSRPQNWHSSFAVRVPSKPSSTFTHPLCYNSDQIRMKRRLWPSPSFQTTILTLTIRYVCSLAMDAEAGSSGRAVSGGPGDSRSRPASRESSSPMPPPGEPAIGGRSSYGERMRNGTGGPSSDLIKIIGQLTGLSARVVRTETAQEGHTGDSPTRLFHAYICIQSHHISVIRTPSLHDLTLPLPLTLLLLLLLRSTNSLRHASRECKQRLGGPHPVFRHGEARQRPQCSRHRDHASAAKAHHQQQVR